MPPGPFDCTWPVGPGCGQVHLNGRGGERRQLLHLDRGGAGDQPRCSTRVWKASAGGASAIQRVLAVVVLSMRALIRWLLNWCWPRHSAVARSAPHSAPPVARSTPHSQPPAPRSAPYGAPPVARSTPQGEQPVARSAPQGGPPVARSTPHGGEAELERADAALAALARTWAGSTSCARPTGARDIACAFHRCLAAQPHLVGLCVPSGWVHTHYPTFCKWLGLDRAPPYRDFARELAFLMPRGRQETWHDGERVRTRTMYFVAPADAAQAAPANPQSESGVACLELDRKTG